MTFILLTCAILIVVIFAWLQMCGLKPMRTAAPVLRRKQRAAANQPQRHNRKPAWIQSEVLRLLAISRGHVGCRTVAALFNQRFAFRGASVSKSYVALLRKKSRFEILQLRRKLRQPPKPGEPNQTWALDWTHLTIGGKTHTLLGVMDHGSRKVLTLCLADRTAKTVLNALNQLIKTFGKPKSLRTDNDGALVSLNFAIAMRRLRIRHQRTPPHSPWCNGRIERFFGTFKAAIRQIQMDSTARLQQAIVEFTFFYNHIRLHQNLNYRTPEMVWLGKTQFPKSKNPQWFAGWGGVLCGWYWDD